MQFQTLLAIVMASASAVMATHEVGQGCQKSAVDTYGCTANGATLVSIALLLTYPFSQRD